MGRPRKTETRIPVSIRLTKTTLARVDLLARQDHETRTQTIERILANHLESDCAVAEHEGATSGKRIAEGAYTRSQILASPITTITLDSKTATAQRINCPHHRKARQNLGYATICGDCGLRL